MFLKVFFFLLPLYAISFEIIPESASTRGMGYLDFAFETDGELKLMQQILRPQQVVFDVGGNRGLWSLCALEIEPSIHLSSFEPIPDVFAQLVNNIGNYPGVHCYNIAISDTIGKCDFYYYDQSVLHSEQSGFYHREILKTLFDPPQVLIVDQNTLTSFCTENKIDHIDFIKIDTEGAEWKVLKGAEELIKNHQIDIIQFEYGGSYIDAQTTLEQVYRFLTSYDYLIFRIYPEGLIQMKKWDSDFENFMLSYYCAVHKEKLDQYFPREEQ